MIEFTDVVKSYTQGNKALNGVTMQIEDVLLPDRSFRFR